MKKDDRSKYKDRNINSYKNGDKNKEIGKKQNTNKNEEDTRNKDKMINIDNNKDKMVDVSEEKNKENVAKIAGKFNKKLKISYDKCIKSRSVEKIRNIHECMNQVYYLRKINMNLWYPKQIADVYCQLLKKFEQLKVEDEEDRKLFSKYIIETFIEVVNDYPNNNDIYVTIDQMENDELRDLFFKMYVVQDDIYKELFLNNIQHLDAWCAYKKMTEDEGGTLQKTIEMFNAHEAIKDCLCLKLQLKAYHITCEEEQAPAASVVIEKESEKLIKVEESTSIQEIEFKENQETDIDCVQEESLEENKQTELGSEQKDSDENNRMVDIELENKQDVEDNEQEEQALEEVKSQTPQSLSNEEIYKQNMLLLKESLEAEKLKTQKQESRNEQLKQNIEVLTNKCSRLEAEREQLKQQLERAENTISEVYEVNNRIKKDNDALQQAKEEALTELEKIEEANMTLSTMMEKGDQFKEGAYKKKLASKLKLEHDQFADIKEVIEAGVEDEQAKDMMDLLYMSLSEVWNILQKNDIEF